jgi:TonB-linked SusC/RagA family outer membrane protein
MRLFKSHRPWKLQKRLVLPVLLMNVTAVLFLVICLPANANAFSPRENANTSPAVVNITGKVTNDKGEPLSGVSVTVAGAKTGTTTNNEGRFVLNVSNTQNVILEITYVGYEKKTVNAGNQTDINIVLVKVMQSLDDVVVVGFGTQKKINLTGAVSTVKFEGALENRPITNASQALGGAVPGVWVSQNSGSPGSDAAQIRVRGWGTLNNSNPLVLIDGVEGSMNEINPNDIENITVLKDAASSAIYGSKAANGVVLVTLKTGKYSGATQVNLSSYVGVQSLGKRYDLVDNSVEYMNLWNQALVNQGGSKIFPDDVISKFQNNNDPYKYPNTNFFDEVFRKAPITEHNLSLRGGSDKTKYYMSFNYMDQDGIIINTNSKRYGLTVNVDSKVKDWLTIGGRINGIKKQSEQPYDFGRILYIFANGAYPVTAPYTSDGRFGAVEALNSTGAMIVGNRNPLIETANGKNKGENNFLKMNAFADIKFASFLTLKTSFTSQYNNFLADRYNQRITGYTSTGIAAGNLDYINQLTAIRTDVQSNYNVLYSTLNFNKKLGRAHEISALAGMQVENSVIKNSLSQKTDPPKEGLTQVDAGTAGILAGGNMNALRGISYFGRANYVLSDKYLFEVDFRADASSRFQEGYRWGYFPAFSAGWRIGEENFIKNLNIFSNMKLRASWGKLGNQNIDQYWPYLTVISQTNALSNNFGGAFAPGAAVTSLVEDRISWETAVTSDFGLEFGVLDNRLSVEADYFRKTTKGIIVQLPIPLDLGGMQAPFENVGEMTNNGMEISINYSNNAKSIDKLGFSIGGNVTYILNEVTKFRKNSPDQLYLIREGYSYRELYGLKAVGIYQTDKEAKDHLFANGFIPHAGDLKFEDVNKDGKIGFEDKSALGNTIPKFTYGFNTSFSYKGFDLAILLQGIAGASLYTQNAWTQPFGISGGTVTKRWKNAWTPTNTQTDIPSIKINDTWNGQASSFWVSEVSFVKLKNIQLGYNFPASIISKIHLPKLYVYINAQNVGSLVGKGYEGFDPERNTFDAGENFYPIPRIFSFGVNLTL